MEKNPNIFLDIDDVIFNFNVGFANYFKIKPHKTWVSSNQMMKRLKHLTSVKEFWLTLPIKNVPNFMPKGYVSARGIHKTWTKESLRINNIPGRSNVHQVYWGESKIDKLKSLECEIFIDDKYETFKECHKNGIFCLLMDAPHNRKYKTKYRIHDLDIDKIIEMYKTLK